MSVHEGGLTPREHSEMRDLVLAGTQRIRPAGSRTQFVAVGVSLVLVGVVTGGILTLTLRDTELPTLSVPPPPAPTSTPAPEGWVAYSAGSFAGDIFFVTPGSAPHLVVGDDDSTIDRVCPAFSADGTQLAFGQGLVAESANRQEVALVITELTAAGDPAGSRSIPLEEIVRPPCPIWSPDSRWVAFGAETQTAETLGVVDQVWVVNAQSGETRRLTGLSATDIEWAPDSAELYVAGDAGGISVYSIGDDQTTLLADTKGAATLTASPDGRMLVVERRVTNSFDRYDLVLMNTDGSDQRPLADDYSRVNGIGPVFSPDGSRVVFQRTCQSFTSTSGAEWNCREHEEVVIVTVGDQDPAPLGTQRVMATLWTNDGEQPRMWFPYVVTWSPDGKSLLALSWEQLEVAADARGASAALITVPVHTVPVDDAAQRVILWETSEGIGSFTAFPKNDFQSWRAQ